MPTPLLLALLLTLGMACQWLAWRLKLPAILPLLLTGLIIGPWLQIFSPDELLGDLLFPFVSLGVAIILFEGSLTLKLSEAKSVARIIRNLTSIGVLVTLVVMGAAAHYLVGLSWQISLLFGALVSVTGPTVVTPMLRSIRPTSRIANILRWEGIIVDPIGAVLAVLVFELIVTGHQSESLLAFVKVVALGSVWGIAGGAVLGFLLKRHMFPDYLQNYAALALVLLVFTASNALGEESGLIAVTVMGMVLANTKDVNIQEILSFKEHLTVVLISVFFILLAARIDFALITQIGGAAFLVLLVGVFIARPLSVAISSIGTSVNWREASLLAWVAPRGIIAAAISALFALRLEEAEVAGADAIVPLTFIMIIGTVVIQSLSAGWFARKLGLSSAGEQGVLISGSNKVALMLGEALKKNDVRVKVIDTNREGLKQARMLGLETFYGNPLSEQAERYMDLSGYTHLLAISRSPETNAVIASHYRHDFGHGRVFSIYSDSGDTEDSREGIGRNLRANMLFGSDAGWTKLASLIAKGAVVKSTGLSEEFDYEAYRVAYGKQAIVLFALTDQGKLKVFSSRDEIRPQKGWTVVALVVEESDNNQKSG